LTFDHDSEAVLYINGIPLITHDLSSDNAAVGCRRLTLGSFNTDFDWGFIEAAIFKSTLTAAEVKEAYNFGNYLDLKDHSQNSSLEHYWTFGDHAADIFNNNGNDNVTATVNDTVGSNNLIVSNEDSGDEIIPFKHTFGPQGELRVHYRSTGSLPNVATNNHYWTIDDLNKPITMNVKTKEIYISKPLEDRSISYSLQADLTNIPSSRMYQHTGSGVDE
jgi:hypothetical protein